MKCKVTETAIDYCLQVDGVYIDASPKFVTDELVVVTINVSGLLSLLKNIIPTPDLISIKENENNVSFFHLTIDHFVCLSFLDHGLL